MTVSAAAAAVARASHSKWWPTRKWWAATIVAFGGFLATLATHNWHLTPEFSGAVITIATQRLVAYVVPNDPPPANKGAHARG
jgi:hypothetical protein